MKTIIIPINTLAEKRGGLVKAAVQKANLLSQEKDYKIVILVLSYQKHLLEVVMDMKNDGKLAEAVDVINVIEFLNPNPSNRVKNLKIDEKKLTKIRDGKNYRFYDNGIYVMFKNVNKVNGRIEFIDHFKMGRVRFLREEFDFRGNLTRYVEYGNKNTATMHRYVDKNKKCFLSIWIDEETHEWKRAIDFNTGKEYKGMGAFYIDIINKIVQNFENPVIFSLFSEKLKNIPEDGKNLDYIISKLDSNVKKISSLHNTHLLDPYNNKNEVQPIFRDLFENTNFDRIVVLTEAQKKDIESVFNRDIEVIPNSCDFPIREYNVGKDINRIIMISRIDAKKRVDLAIEIMKIISNKDPKLYLDFYGFGYKDELEEEIYSKVKDYSLKNFNFKGFTSNINEELQKSGMSILTSDTEAFPLTIIESIANNVPCISFDIKYGPKDMIKSGKNGYLIEQNNIEGFADKIIECKERLKRGEFKNISSTVLNISSDKVKKQWIDLIESL
ncbi:glycosyltransferase [Methanobacterium bryantii]|uniref:Glycosyl transferase family 1 domain-containing protein n=1 Tax=Methanobacterium bryantii TaxID=2161 RepID=A0A2A2HAD2_METBR|nr:glycosyltransferase [Methanobacterium bryantii]PAV06305.1 hypothetical protein ASJ80_15890 [Methanobacterium bryantii]